MCSTGLNALRAIVVHSCRSQIGLCQEVAINSDQRYRERHGGDANAESFRYVRVTLGPTAERDNGSPFGLTHQALQLGSMWAEHISGRSTDSR
jgi:hypothetical protein